ncbi:hypothetical protein [Salinarimonas chemoclinalis]|uniref:hypothetical protein n=1 Tax=Salinarimonas chemoclinalis TaxID=3241599 RepID=UPI00355680DA
MQPRAAGTATASPSERVAAASTRTVRGPVAWALAALPVLLCAFAASAAGPPPLPALGGPPPLPVVGGPPPLPVVGGPPPLPAVGGRPPPSPDARGRFGPPPLPGSARGIAAPVSPRSSPPPSPPPLPETARRAGPPPLADAAAGVRPQTLRLVRRAFHDRSGFGTTIEAYTMLLPADWSVEGGVVWSGSPGAPTCMSNSAQLIMEATSPGGRFGVAMLPAPTVSWMTTHGQPQPIPGLETMPNTLEMAAQGVNQDLARQWNRPGSVCRVTSRADEVGLSEEAFLRTVRPGARVIERGDLPQARATLQRTLDPMQAGGFGPPVEAFAFAVRARIDAPGGPLEERYEFFGIRNVTSIDSFDGITTVQIALSGQPVFALRYPAGRFAEVEPLARAIGASLRANPRWSAAMARHRAEIARINREGAAARSQIWRDVSREISDAQMEGWRMRSETEDRLQALSVDQIREVEPMRDPTTGTRFEVPNLYESVYRNPRGELVMSTDPTFDARTAFPDETWTRLDPDPR